MTAGLNIATTRYTMPSAQVLSTYLPRVNKMVEIRNNGFVVVV